MSLLHQKSPECTLAELDLFSAPMTQLSIEDKKYQECQPLSALSDNAPIEFFIPGDGEKFLDLNDTLLHLRVKITEKDRSNIPPDTAVALINYPLNTIFSQCDVVLGDRLISQSSATQLFQPQFDRGNSVREFYHMFSTTGRHLKDLPLSIDRREFNEGYSLFAFNLEPTEDCDALSPVSSGNLRLEMRFRVPLPQTTTLIVYACYDSILEINGKRQVLVDYY